MRLGMNRRFVHKRTSAICVCILILLALLFIILSSLYIIGLEPVFPVYAEKYAEYITEKAVNEASAEVFGEISDIHTIKSQENNISFLNSDIQKINSLKSKINHTISEKIEKNASGIKIPLGSLSGISLLSGIGPEIPVYAEPIVITTSEIENEFISAGINQTKYRVYLNINVDITFICSSIEYNKTIPATVLISESVIVGNVPDLYNYKNTE